MSDLKPGTLFQITVGMPGPDMENAIVLSSNEDGSHDIARSHMITGAVTEQRYTHSIIPGIRYPFQSRGIDELEQHFLKSKET